MSQDIVDLGFRVNTLELEGANRELRELDRAGGRAEGRNRTLMSSFGGLAAAAGALGFGAAIRGTSNYVDQLKEVSTLVDTNVVSMKEISTEAKLLSQEFGAMPIDNAKAFYTAISAGALTAAEATETLEIANKLAIGGVTDIETAVSGLSAAANAYGKETITMTEIADSLFVAMKSGTTKVGELVSGIGKVAQVAAPAGVSLDELLSATAALTKGGATTSTAMDGIRAVVASIIKPSGEAGKAAGLMGLDFNAAALESKGLAGFLSDVAEKTGGSTEKMALLFGGIEALTPALALTGKASEDFSEILEKQADKTGALEEATTKMSESPGFQMSRILASLSAGFIGLTESITTGSVPALTTIADVLPIAFGAIQGVIDTITDSYTEFTDALANSDSWPFEALRDFGELLEKAGEYLKFAVPYLDDFAIALLALGGGAVIVAALGASFALLTSPITLTAAAITLVAIGVKKLYENWDEVVVWFGGIWDAMEKRVDDFVAYLRATPTRMYNAGKDTVTGFIDGAKGLLGDVFGLGGDTGDAYVKGVEKSMEMKSPSKRMMRVGVFAVEGLTEGILSGLDLLASAMEQVSGEIERGIAKSILDGDSVKDMFRNLGDFMETWLREQVANFAANRIMVSLGLGSGDMSGNVISSLFGGASGGTGGATAANAGSASFYGAAGAGVQSGQGFLAANGGAMATSATVLAMAVAANEIGTAMGRLLNLSNPENAGIGSVIGGIPGALIGGSLPSGWQTASQGVSVGVNDGNFEGDAYEHLRARGGFSGTRNIHRLSELDAATETALNGYFTNLNDTIVGQATSLGVSGADSILQGFNMATQIFTGGTANDDLQEWLEISTRQAYAQAFDNMSPELAAYMNSAVDIVNDSVEDIAEAFATTAAGFTAVTDATVLLGLNFDSLDPSAVGASAALVELMGGLDQFQSATQSYYNEYYTLEERQKIALAEAAIEVAGFNAALNANGVQSITSRDQFMQLVEGLDLSTEAGRALWAQAMDVSGSFAAVADSTQNMDEIIAALPDNLQGSFSEMRAAANYTARSIGSASNSLFIFSDSVNKAGRMAAAEVSRISALGRQANPNAVRDTMAMVIMNERGVTFSEAVEIYEGVYDGSHANGLMSVPFDGYRAELHQGEAVLTRPEANAYRQGGSSAESVERLTQIVKRLEAIQNSNQAAAEVATEVLSDIANESRAQAVAINDLRRTTDRMSTKIRNVA